MANEDITLMAIDAGAVMRAREMKVADDTSATKISVIGIGKDKHTIVVALAEKDASARCVSLDIGGDHFQLPMGTEKVRVVHDEGSRFPEYYGDTNIVPGVTGKTLPTKHTSVMRDITVEAIPYAETSNPSGGYTAVIGE